jgi:outer membrane protein
VLVVTQTARAQSEPGSASDDRADVATQQSTNATGSGPATDAQVMLPQFNSGRWFSRIGYLFAGYHSSTSIAMNGKPISGGTAEASNNLTLTFDFGYEVTKNISALVTVGIPPKPHVTGEGSVSSLGMLGKVRYGPVFLTSNYYFPKVARVRPYVGGGGAYAIIFKEFDGSVKDLQVHNNWGSILQGGAEYEVNSNYSLFVDFKEVWLSVNARGVLSDGSDVRARVKLNPSLVSVGIRFRLPFGRGR